MRGCCCQVVEAEVAGSTVVVNVVVVAASDVTSESHVRFDAATTWLASWKHFYTVH